MSRDSIRRAFGRLLALAVLAAPAVAAASEAAGEAAGNPWYDLIMKFVNFAILVGMLFYFLRKPVTPGAGRPPRHRQARARGGPQGQGDTRRRSTGSTARGGEPGGGDPPHPGGLPGRGGASEGPDRRRGARRRAESIRAHAEAAGANEVKRATGRASRRGGAARGGARRAAAGQGLHRQRPGTRRQAHHRRTSRGSIDSHPHCPALHQGPVRTGPGSRADHGSRGADSRPSDGVLSEQEDLRTALLSPVLTRTAKAEVLEALLGAAAFDPLVANFLRVLLEARKLRYLGDVLGAYRDMVDDAERPGPRRGRDPAGPEASEVARPDRGPGQGARQGSGARGPGQDPVPARRRGGPGGQPGVRRKPSHPARAIKEI